MSISIYHGFAAGFAVVLLCSVPGCLVVWRRMAYFGDALAHSGMLGVALGLLYGLPINLGVGLVAGIFALLLLWLQHRSLFAIDTLLGVMAHAGLALGVVVLSFVSLEADFDVEDFLFGDMWAASIPEIIALYVVAAVMLGLLGWFWPSLVLASIHPALARAEGVRMIWVDALVLLLVSLAVSMAVRIVGILLVTSILIIPAAAARQVARSPAGMAFSAVAIGGLSVVGGVGAYELWRVPAPATTVCVAVLLFVLLSLFAHWRDRQPNPTSNG